MMRTRALSAKALMDAWEHGLPYPPAHRALILLAAAFPDTSLQALAELSIGQRNAYLLTLREQTFGSRLSCRTACPVCTEQVELCFTVAQIRAAPDVEPPSEITLKAADHKIRFRLPNSLDLMALTDQADAPPLYRQLLERCLLTVDYHGQAKTIDQLPPEVEKTIAAKMAQADPQADIELAMSCPVCAHQWVSVFDIVTFFWDEINAWAYRTLYEVHQLASAYGWSETDVLALSPWKRQFYLKLVSR